MDITHLTISVIVTECHPTTEFCILLTTISVASQTERGTDCHLQRGQGEEYNLKALPSALSFDGEYGSGGRQGAS